MGALTAEQKRFQENASLIAAMRLIFNTLEKSGVAILPIGQIATTASGGTPDRKNSSFFGGPIPWIKSGELNDGIIDHVEETITEEALIHSSARVFPAGTVVVALYGATVGKTGVLSFDAATNQAVCAVKPLDSLVKHDFLFWFLRNKRLDFIKSSFGGAQPNISQTFLREVMIPVPSVEIQREICSFLQAVERRQAGNKDIELPNLSPPLSDQRRIVARVEELVAKIEEARGLRARTTAEAHALSAAYLNRLFGDPYEKTVGTLGFTEFRSIGDVSNDIADGPHVTPTYTDSGVPFITVLNITSGVVNFEKHKFITRAAHEEYNRRAKAERGDVLISKDGTIGVPCYVNTDREFSFFVSVALVKPKKEIIDGKFLAWVIRSPYMQRRIRERSRGDMIRHLVLREIRDLHVPCPQLEVQRQLVRRLETFKKKTDGLTKQQAWTVAELDALLPSILDRAFKGEL